MDQFYLLIHEWMTSGTAIAALGCFVWGVVSVMLSPCHLASIPLIVGYVGGQDRTVEGRMATVYALLFTFGLFLTIAAVGIVCAFLGRMLGDVGSWWTIIIGLILIWVALDLMGVSKCSMSGGGGLMGKLRLRGAGGAFFLGLAYGVLSGSCTFGFIAPILGIITVQGKIGTGILFILLFGIGHAIPIAVAGSSTALVKRFLANSAWQRGSQVFRKVAGLIIAVIGIYFIIQPFLS